MLSHRSMATDAEGFLAHLCQAESASGAACLEDHHVQQNQLRLQGHCFLNSNYTAL